jgi:hypothetical protein
MVFDSKGLTDKVFENKRLSGDLLGLVVKERPKMGFWQLHWPPLEDGHTSDRSDQIAIIVHCGLEVCDGEHRAFVMKKNQRPRPSLRGRT